MTIYGWDLSHFDAPDSRAAVAEGFSFLTHKAGGDKDDAEIGTWWNYMKPYRDRVLLGAYWVQYPGSPAARADRFIARLDATCPGWREGPFILQVDCEEWNNNPATKPSRSEIQTFCDRLVHHMPKLRPIVYAPKWAYGDSLTGLTYPLWASRYVSGSGPASSLYPGDGSALWGAYSGQTPKILQFTSSATIAGQTTCDANAYRGTLTQLTTLTAPGWANQLEDDVALIDDLIVITEDTAHEIGMTTGARVPAATLLQLAVIHAARSADDAAAAAAAAAAQKLRDEAILAAVRDDADRAEILARVDAKAAELAEQISQVDEEVWAKVRDPATPDEVVAAALEELLGDRKDRILALMQPQV